MLSKKHLSADISVQQLGSHSNSALKNAEALSLQQHPPLNSGSKVGLRLEQQLIGR